MKSTAGGSFVHLYPLALLATSTFAQRVNEEDQTAGQWILDHIIVILGVSVLCLVFLWCCCSIHAGRAEKRAQELRRQNRQEQEEEELQIQTSLYTR